MRQIPTDQLDDIRCSLCGGELDTGFECNDCDHDMMPEIEPERFLDHVYESPEMTQ